MDLKKSRVRIQPIWKSKQWVVNWVRAVDPWVQVQRLHSGLISSEPRPKRVSSKGQAMPQLPIRQLHKVIQLIQLEPIQVRNWLVLMAFKRLNLRSRKLKGLLWFRKRSLIKKSLMAMVKTVTRILWLGLGIRVKIKVKTRILVFRLQTIGVDINRRVGNHLDLVRLCQVRSKMLNNYNYNRLVIIAKDWT